MGIYLPIQLGVWELRKFQSGAVGWAKNGFGAFMGKIPGKDA